MKYRRYPAYKDSGVDSIDSIPIHWTLSVLGYEANVKARLGWRGLKAEEYVDDGYIFLATPNIKDTEIDFVNVNHITQERYDESPEIMLRVGDVLVTKDGSTVGTSNVVRLLPSPSTVNSSIAVIRPKQGVDGVFLNYFFQSSVTQSTIQRMKGGMGVPHLFQADLRKFKISMPSYAEQVAIATFLDRETAQIDTLIAKQERLIALLQEKRHALISHAVTKGLNPAAPMKESGDKWIGVIPDHWMCQQLKHVVAVPVTDGPHVTPELIADGIPFLSAEAVKNNKLDFSKKRGFIDPAVHEVFARKCQPVRNDVLMVKSGNTTGAIAWVDTDEVFSIWSPLALIRANRELMSPRYLFYYTNEAPFQISILLACSYGTQPNIGMGVIERQPVTVPPVEEQVRIAAFLDRETAKIDDLVEKTHGAIVLAKERRSALISAAVTGKIDVRTLVN